MTIEEITTRTGIELRTEQEMEDGPGLYRYFVNDEEVEYYKYFVDDWSEILEYKHIRNEKPLD